MTLIKLVGSAYSDLMWAIWPFWKTAKLGSNKNLPNIQTLNSARHVRLVPMNIKSKIKISWKSWFPSNKWTSSSYPQEILLPYRHCLFKATSQHPEQNREGESKRGCWFCWEYQLQHHWILVFWWSWNKIGRGQLPVQTHFPRPSSRNQEACFSLAFNLKHTLQRHILFIWTFEHLM